MFLIVRLFESWRVTAHGASHQVSILGQQLGYPSANADAIVIVVLAALGFVVTARALRRAVRELAASRRFLKTLASHELTPLRGALLIDDPQPRAFCAGLFRAGYISPLERWQYSMRAR